MASYEEKRKSNEIFAQRRSEVAELLKLKDKLSHEEKKMLSLKYKCHVSAIVADITYTKRLMTGEKVTGFTSQSVRNIVRRRDGCNCCYCGDCSEDNVYIVEHVIASVLGGHGRTYNLVMACQSCNVQKGDDVWIPANLHVLAEENPEYCQKILKLYSEQVNKN